MASSSLISIADAAFEPAVLVNNDGDVLHINKAAESLLEFALKEGEKTEISSFCCFENEGAPVEWAKVTEELGAGKSQKWVGACTKKSGDTFDAEVRGSQIEGTLCFFFKPVENETRFDHMTRYMSTLLNMLTSIIETSLDPIFQINEEGVIQMVNESAVRNFQWTRDEFIGSNVSMLCGGDHGPKHAEYLKRYLKTGETRVMGSKRELPAKRKDGSEFPIELGLVEIYNDTTQERMFVGFIRDLTEIKKRERLSTGIIEASFDPMFTIDSKGTIQFANDAASKEFGFTKEEFIGNNIKCIVGSEHAPNHDQYIAHYLETGEARVMGKKRPLKARRKDGSEFSIELGLANIQVNKGEDPMFCGFVRNLE
mmetsp:Transcript_23634/g.55014  ORF Transcript_23634/g.55014 Transcript_23634/m.55014 type:complete len:369 (+) Transcript_23634:101-1207(+)|eukprot:CAMPEP_0116844776 /NCGR_PEP_ID=MMETSP0418-20121206/12889_1 /TAXON_ID=1158023 /ORGANISM="Astrosyne radiata, Strain 13vi08-1A" /LENGTH=368 /DNA_ID=CAMNT_0004475793 /DNA_START=32 /DNA_END=1138 /DNA_ORIENTATION=-